MMLRLNRCEVFKLLGRLSSFHLLLYFLLLLIHPHLHASSDNSTRPLHSLVQNLHEFHSLWGKVNDHYYDIYTVVQSAANKSSYVVSSLEKTWRLIPDPDTIEFLGYNSSLLSVVSDDVLNHHLSRGSEFPSLKLPAYNPDELMHRAILKVRSLLPPINYVKSFRMIENVLNPSIIRLKGRSEILICWYNHWSGGELNTHTQSPLLFGLIQAEDFKNDSVKLDLSKIKRVQLKEGRSLELHNNFPFKADPRLSLLPNGSISIIHATFVGNNKRSGKFYLVELIAQLVGTGNGDDEIEYLDSRILVLNNKYYHHDQNQKNWVPFTHKDHLYYIQHLNPFYAIKTIGPTENGGVQTENVSYCKMGFYSPWKQDYGVAIRGGSPAIYLPKQDLYLTFFHTINTFQVGFNLVTYFMGALTFEANFPFKVHSMSMYPMIIQNWLYEAAWTTKTIDYVVFPMGVVLDEDLDHVHLSMGWQDHNGFIAKIHVDEFLKSLTRVKHPPKEQECFDGYAAQ